MLALLAPVVTGTLTFSIGAIDVGPIDGFSPGGHFDLGISYGNVRVQGELDAGLWANENAPTEMPESGSYRRVGGALRYYFANLDVARSKRSSQLRLFVEGGMGRQWIRAASVDVQRPDVALGFGMAQESSLGPAKLGGYFGVRMQFAEAPEPALSARAIDAAPQARRHDLAIFFMLGMVIGK